MTIFKRIDDLIVRRRYKRWKKLTKILYPEQWMRAMALLGEGADQLQGEVFSKTCEFLEFIEIRPHEEEGFNIHYESEEIHK